jgi:hypothetical protein
MRQNISLNTRKGEKRTEDAQHFLAQQCPKTTRMPPPAPAAVAGPPPLPPLPMCAPHGPRMGSHGLRMGWHGLRMGSASASGLRMGTQLARARMPHGPASGIGSHGLRMGSGSHGPAWARMGSRGPRSVASRPTEPSRLHSALSTTQEVEEAERTCLSPYPVPRGGGGQGGGQMSPEPVGPLPPDKLRLAHA